MNHILFFANGNTAVIVDDKQAPDLQKPWAMLFAEFLEASGRDPLEFEVSFENGTFARFLKTSDGWSWRIKDAPRF